MGFQAHVLPSFLVEGGAPVLRHLKLVAAVLANPNTILSLKGLTYLELDPGELTINNDIFPRSRRFWSCCPIPHH